VLPGTENAVRPFFSPDGQWIGFVGNGHLRKISVRGGAPIPLATAPYLYGGTWGRDGSIVAALNAAAPLSRIPDTGGTPEEVVSIAESGSRGLQFPQLLPGGHAVLFTAIQDAPAIYVKNLETRKTERLVENATIARCPSPKPDL
jgi:Tol biopolymer transport system component